MRCAVFTAAFLFALNAQAAECGPHADVVKFLAEKYKETRRALGVSGHPSRPLMSELYVSLEGTWTLVLTTPTGIACIAAAGKNWRATEDVPKPGDPDTL